MSIEYNPDEWVSISVAASMLGAPVSYVQKAIEEGRLSSEKIEGRTRLRLDEVNKLVDTLAK